MSTNQNRRFRDTDEKIVQTVYEVLIRENAPIEKISVRKICELAGINRSTFYAHFQDVYDVLEQTERYMSRQLTEKFLTQFENGASLEQCYCAVFQFIRNEREFYSYYLNETNRVAAVGMAWELVQDKLARLDFQELGCKSEAELTYRADFFLTGVNAVIRRWLNSGCQETPRELSKLLAQQYHFEKAVFD